MYSKSLMIAVVLFAFMTSGCSQWLNEDPPKNSIIELDKNKSRCLKDWSSILDRYFLGQSNNAEMDEFWLCLQGVVKHFQKHAKGETPGVYSISELRKFLEDFFLNPKKIPDNLVEKFKDLKKAIFSGDRNNFNQEDIKRLIFILEEFRLASVQLLPHISVVTFKAQSAPNLDAAINAVEQISVRWQKQLSPIHSSYRIEDLLKFWAELKQTLDVKVFTLDDEKWELLLKSANALKGLLVGAPHDEILRDDWPVLYNRISDALRIGLLYHYRFKGTAWHSQTAVESIKTVVTIFFNNVRASIMRHPENKIPMSLFAELGTAIAENKWLGSEGIRPKSLSDGLVNIVYRLGKNKIGLTSDGLIFIEEAIAKWVITQSALNQIFTDTKRLDKKIFQERLQKIIGTSDNTENFYPNYAVVALTEFKNILKDITLKTMKDDLGQFIFSRDSEEKNYIDFESTMHLNWMLRVVNLIYFGYGTYPSQVTEDEFDLFYREFREFGIDLKLLDKNVTDSARRTFMEANTFTFHGNGDASMSNVEALEELQILISGGKTARYLIDGVTQSCIVEGKKCLNNSLDQFGRAPVNIGVFKQFLVDHFVEYFSHLPRMTKSFSTWDAATKYSFIDLVVDFAASGQKNDWITLGHARTISGLLHFAESIFLRYDYRKTDLIDVQGIDEAFMVFKPLLEKILISANGKSVESDKLRVGFAYFLVNGESLIKGDGIWDNVNTYFEYQHMKSQLEKNAIKLNRFQIVRAMASFKKFAKKN